MSKISNVITMMELLSNGRKYSIKELSEKLGEGFSTSTIQRYFHELYEKKIIPAYLKMEG